MKLPLAIQIVVRLAVAPGVVFATVMSNAIWEIAIGKWDIAYGNRQRSRDSPQGLQE